jgi:hypothetical protein
MAATVHLMSQDGQGFVISREAADMLGIIRAAIEGEFVFLFTVF